MKHQKRKMQQRNEWHGRPGRRAGRIGGPSGPSGPSGPGGSGARGASRGGPREKIYIYGKHALMEALLNAPRAIRKVFIASELDDNELREMLKKQNVPTEIMKMKEADRMVGEETVHQGVIAIADPGEIMGDFSEFAKGLEAKSIAELSERTMVVLLDELTDPHNVGAIIRSAAAFGATAVLMPIHNQAPITGAVVKSSAGMVFRVPLVSVGNVNQAVDALKKIGFRSYGLEMNGSQNLTEEKFADAPTLIIVGNEGKGIREKTLERCDVHLRIPMDPRAESLNASVSAAVVMYQWSKEHLIS